MANEVPNCTPMKRVGPNIVSSSSLASAVAGCAVCLALLRTKKMYPFNKRDNMHTVPE